MAVRVQSQPFDVGEEMGLMQRADTLRQSGAMASFVGLCRASEAHAQAGAEVVTRMHIEHYPGMTEAALEHIEAEARRRWALHDVLILHRYGDFVPGDAIVLVLVASAHRADALAACAFLMDYLKTDAPFWKKEFTTQGERWAEARLSDDDARARWLKA